MEFDYGQVLFPVGGVIVYPDFPHSSQPAAPSSIKDSASIQGSAATGGGITGSAIAQGQIG